MTALELAGEWLIIVFFLVTGVSNLTKARIADHIERMESLGTPFPATAFWLGIAAQLTGCALLALGWHPAIGALLLIAFTITATATFHRFWQKTDPMQRNYSRLTLLSNMALVGGLLLLLARLT